MTVLYFFQSNNISAVDFYLLLFTIDAKRKTKMLIVLICIPGDGSKAVSKVVFTYSSLK